MRLQNKKVIITGSSRGIGRILALMFVAEGAQVVISSRNEDELDLVRKEISDLGGVVYSKIADMRKPEQIEILIEYAYSCMGGINVLINNAGLPRFGFAIDDPSPEAENKFHAVIETNFMGYWYAARQVIPYMKKQGSGSIINISSVRGHLGLANESVYCGVKGALGMFGKALAVELAPHNIRVNTISPGAIQVETIGHWIRSSFSQEAQQEFTKKFASVFEQGMLLNQPMKKIGRSEDVGYAAIYLASDESTFVTGADIVIDGGLTSVLAEPPALDLKGLSEYYLASEEMRVWLENLKTGQA